MKLVDIEKLLQWAYRDELPKQSVGGLKGWERRMYLGFDENPNPPDREAQLPIALGPPHDDAVQLDYAVRSLDPVMIAWPAGRELLAPDIGAFVHLDPAVARLHARPKDLVQHHAIMGTRPVWDLGTIRLLRITHIKNGKPVINGLTAGRRYAEGAHSPLRLDPKGADIIEARFEYLAWRSALVELVRRVRESRALKDHDPQHPQAAQAPWITGPERTARVLRTIEPPKVSLTTKRGRPLRELVC